MTIRPTTVRDLGWLSATWAKFCKGQAPDLDGWVEQTLGLMASGLYVGRVMEGADGLIGFVDGTLLYDPATRESCFVSRHSWLDEQYRGEGLGMELYRSVYEHLKGLGVHRLVIEGDHAVALCEKMTGEKMVPRSTYWTGRIV